MNTNTEFSPQNPCKKPGMACACKSSPGEVEPDGSLRLAGHQPGLNWHGPWSARDPVSKQRCLATTHGCWHIGPQVTRPSQNLSFSTSWLRDTPHTHKSTFPMCLFPMPSAVKGAGAGPGLQVSWGPHIMGKKAQDALFTKVTINTGLFLH